MTSAITNARLCRGRDRIAGRDRLRQRLRQRRGRVVVGSDGERPRLLRDGGLSFDQTKLDAKAGAVTIAFENPGSSGNEHGVAVKGGGVDKTGPVVGPGQERSLELDLKAGDYTFYCPVGGHEKAGMKGALSVSGSGGGSESGGGGSGGGS